MSSPPAKRRAAGAVPSWQDKLEKLNRLLRQKSERWKSHLRPNSSVEDVLQAALAQVERQALQVQVLQSKLRQIEAKRADSPKSTVSTPTSENDRKSPSVKKEEQPEIPRFPFLFPNLDISTESVEAAMSQMNSLLYPGPQALIPMSKTLHRELFMLSPIPFFTITTSLHLIDCNDAFAEAFKVYALPNHWSSAGPSRAQMLSMKLSMIDITVTFVPSVLQMLCEGIVTALARGQATVENRVCTAHNGCRFEVDITVWTTYDVPSQPDETLPRPMCVSGLLTKFQPLELIPLKHM